MARKKPKKPKKRDLLPGFEAMATSNVSFDGTRVSAAETATDGGTWDKWAASQTPSQEADFVYQGSISQSNKVSNTSRGGVELENTDSTHNFSAIPKAWLAKTIITNYNAIRGPRVEGSGMYLYIGSANTTDQYVYWIHDSGSYPIAGGWIFTPIDPNIAGYRDAQTGTPDLTAVNYFAISSEFALSSKSDNVAMDAVDYFNIGEGLSISGGDGASTDGTFQDFIDYDEGTSTNRYGIVRTIEGVMYTLGVLTIGNETETDFTDSARTVVFPDGLFGSGFCGISLGLQHSDTVISISDSSFTGRGTSGLITDTRPRYSVSGIGGQATYDGCAFRTFNDFIMSSGVTANDCIISSGLRLIQNSGVISNCTIGEATNADGAAFIESDNLALISNNSFTFSDGFAIEITRSGNYEFTGNIFTGYGSDDTSDAAIWNNSGGPVAISVLGGVASPTVSGTGNTTVSNDVTLTITVKDIFGVGVDGAQVRISDSSDNSEISAGITAGGGIYTDTYNFATEVPVTVRVRLFGWLPFVGSSTITGNGLSVDVRFLEDTIAND